MQPITYGTAGLLFPAIAMLMIAYSNRFISLASLVRDLLSRHSREDRLVKPQIENLRKRISLMKHAQGIGALSLVLCTLSLFALFLGQDGGANWLFSAALVAMIASLGLSLRETYLSTDALNIALDRVTAK